SMLSGIARPSAARADGEPAPPPAAQPADAYEQTDHKKTMSIKLPRTWKSAAGEQADPEAMATFRGTFGPDPNRPGLVTFTVASQFQRASLARAILLPLAGTVKAESMRQGPGWTEGCAINAQQAEWRRYVEKGGRVYVFRLASLGSLYETVHADVEKLLD